MWKIKKKKKGEMVIEYSWIKQQTKIWMGQTQMWKIFPEWNKG